MTDATTITFPGTFAELKASPAEDARVLAVVTLSGKAHGAYYALNGQGEYALRRQASLEKELPAAFAPTATFRDDLDHIPVFDAGGRMKGFFHLQYPDETGRYDAAFIRNYWSPPPEVQRANREMAALMAAKAAPELFPPEAERKRAAQDTPEERAAFLGRIAGALEQSQRVSYTTPDGVSHTLPDDNFRHTNGVANLTTLAAQAINGAAAERSMPAPFSPLALETLTRMGQIHDIGKTQIRTRMNQFELGEYLVHADRAKSPEEQTAIHRQKDVAWKRVNYNHPLLGYVALSCYPELAEAFALHHLSLYRDEKDPVEREKRRHLMLIPNDLATPAEVPYMSQIMRVCDVTDAIINNSRKDAGHMLAELDRKTDQPNHMGFANINEGLRSIDPDVLCFMIDRGVFDQYLGSKLLSPLAAGGEPTRPVIGENFAALKQQILERHHYAERRAQVEASILAKVQAEPMLATFPQTQQQQQPQAQDTRGEWQRLVGGGPLGAPRNAASAAFAR